MRQSLALVSLVVRDYDEALAFYVGTLGFELVEDSPVPEQDKRLASSQCIAPSQVICINGERLLDILREDPASGFVVMQRLAAMIARSFMEQKKG